MQLTLGMPELGFKRCNFCEQDKPWNNGAGWHNAQCPDCYRARMRQWRVANRDYMVAYRQANKERRSSQHRAWRARHLEERRAYCNQWRRNNLDRSAASSRNRYARKLNAACGCSPNCFNDRYAELLAQDGAQCAVEGCSRVDFQADHIIPLIKGGLHCGSNCQLLCRWHNQSKHDKMPDEFDDYCRNI